MCSDTNWIWYSVLLWFHVVVCYLINSNKISSLATFFMPVTAAVHSCFLWELLQTNLSEIYWCLHIGHWLAWLSKAHSEVELNWTWLNVHRLLITLRSRKPERGFFFFPSPASSLASSSLLDSTDFSSSESLTKSTSSLSRCSECWTEGPASAYALIKKNETQVITEEEEFLRQ